MQNGVPTEALFHIKTNSDFLAVALDTFNFQYTHNTVYHNFCNYLNVDPKEVTQLYDIPFLPIQFFKDSSVVSSTQKPAITFSSSGTTGATTSKHFVTDLGVYEQSYLTAFRQYYGAPSDYCILALLPSYLEREGSSLIYMVADLIKKSNHPKSGFFLNNTTKLRAALETLEAEGTKTILIGVSFALLDFAEAHSLQLKHTTIMETGGMKGRRKELIRVDLHNRLCTAFGTSKIHSEYGMTELLSQAYSKGDGVFSCPPWMQVLIRDAEDPLTYLKAGKSGGLNIIDLANRYSCSFIATQDLGKKNSDSSFEVLGRFDNSDIRGCNLMAL